jgi:PPM family protein phosphatase
LDFKGIVIEKEWKMTRTAYGETSVGKVRKNNEDFFICDTTHDVFVVCDGIGGLRYGDIASEVVANIVHEDIVNNIFFGDKREMAKIREVFRETVSRANRKLKEISKKKGRGVRIGTTIVAGIFIENMFCFFHVGDSRIYFIDEKEGETQIERGTKDHNIAEDVISKGLPPGLITGWEKHVLTRSVGMTGPVVPSIGFKDLKNFFGLIFCTDGIYNELTDEEIHRIFLMFDEPTEIGKALVCSSLDRGGGDNLTAIVVK